MSPETRGRFRILWEFEVAPDRAAAFETAYGPGGAWVAFFRQAAGYLGTELFRRTGSDPVYLTLDQWDSRVSYERFRRTHATEYSALDAACQDLTLRETFLGAWES